MQAQPSEDGSHFILNGEKRYITNASIAQVLTVMARTPVPGKDKTAITAFLVTPDMPGFEMIEPRMPKLGIRGTATGRFRLNNVRVPKENILGPVRQRSARRAHRARFRPHHFRRLLHRRGQDLPARSRSSTPTRGNNSTRRSATSTW